MPNCPRLSPNKDPSKILADSLQDDLDNAQKLAILLPDGVKNELQTACATKNPITGVKDNFLVNFICLFQNVPVLGGLIVNICPKEVNFMNQQTECLTQTTLAVENRTRPPEFHPPAQVQACEIIDFGQPSTIGNKDTSSISTQLGGPQGTYSQDTPSEVIVDTDQTQNLSTEGKTFDGDKRVPDINCRCQQYSGANLLEGISFCNDNSLCPR